jgi:hypothetical protein
LSEKRSSLVAEWLLNGESPDGPNPAESAVEKVGQRCRGIHCCPSNEGENGRRPRTPRDLPSERLTGDRLERANGRRGEEGETSGERRGE